MPYIDAMHLYESLLPQLDKQDERTEPGKPMLNLGCGLTRFPGPPPDSHDGLVAPEVYSYPDWLNISRNAEETPDQVMDLFTYPWGLKSDAYEGAVVGHLLEHVPHEIKISNYARGCGLGWIGRVEELANMQDGFFAFMSELWRVLKPDGIAHIICPYGLSRAYMSDPTHTRPIVEGTFGYLGGRNPNATYHYARGAGRFEMIEPIFYAFTPLGMTWWASLPEEARTQENLTAALEQYHWVVRTMYIRLRAVKTEEEDGDAQSHD